MNILRTKMLKHRKGETKKMLLNGYEKCERERRKEMLKGKRKRKEKKGTASKEA